MGAFAVAQKRGRSINYELENVRIGRGDELDGG